ncbi:MAG: methylated-DNA--[protein]-cysteine S-methyltransferase [Planctomycetota bacterium]|nr:methylated-DNA--[protein]-cysteine S-methyltransferase [Planctomycetota bacterium]
MELFGTESEPRVGIGERVGDAPEALASRSAWIATPLGRMLAVASADGSALRALDFDDRRDFARLLERCVRADGGRPVDRDACGALLARAARSVERYFAGEVVGAFDGLTLAPVNATAFARAVWAELARIPAGQTRSYAELAEALRAGGESGAVARSVAAANGANFLAIVVPCHRVIGADGSLTGYGGGLARKRWLLSHERAVARAARASTLR